jgi:hypothetical protein
MGHDLTSVPLSLIASVRMRHIALMGLLLVISHVNPDDDA